MGSIEFSAEVIFTKSLKRVTSKLTERITGKLFAQIFVHTESSPLTFGRAYHYAKSLRIVFIGLVY